MNELTWSIDAEQQLLGAMLLDNAAFDRVGPLAPRDFYDPRNALAYTAMASLALAGRPFDVVLVWEELRRLGKDERSGGLPYLNELSACTPSSRNARHHAEIVREKARQREILLAANQALDIAEEGASSEDKLDRIMALFSQLQRASMARVPQSLAELVVERIDHISALAEGTVKAGIETPLPALNERLNGGLRGGHVYILAARPSIGKSSLANDIGLHVAGSGVPVLVLSQEMPAGEVTDRAISRLGRADYGQIQTGRIDDENWGRITEGVDIAARLPFYIDDQPALRLQDIRGKARLVKGLGLLIVDYLQLCQGGDQDTRNGQIEEISRGLKSLAKELGIPIIVLSQLNRAVEQRADKRPNMGDLRDSGAIEQDADTIVFLWRAREHDHGDTRLIGMGVDKNRQGKLGEVALDFHGATQRWSESGEFLHERPAPRGRGSL